MRFCGIFTPGEPHLLRPADLEAMAGAFILCPGETVQTFFDAEAGLALAALSDEKDPWWHSDDSGAVAFSGYVGPADDGGQRGARLILETASAGRDFEALAGEFAFACWVKRSGELTLATDPLGKWPLYWVQDPASGLLAFATEPKSLLAHPTARREPDPQGLGLYLFDRHVPAPFAAFAGMHRLYYGEALTVSREGSTASHLFWSYPRTALQPATVGEWAEQVHDAYMKELRKVIHGHETVALFLGAGLDSSLIYGLVKSHFPEVRCVPITAHYEEGSHKSPDLDLPYARQLAAYWGDPLVEIELSFRAVGHRLEPLLRQTDQPFADFANHISYDAMGEAATDHGATLILTGQKGGESFGSNDWQKLLKAAGHDASSEDLVGQYLLPRLMPGRYVSKLLRKPPTSVEADFAVCHEGLTRRVLSEDPFDIANYGPGQVYTREHTFASTATTMLRRPVRLFNVFYDWSAYRHSVQIPSEFKGSRDPLLFKALLHGRNRHLIPEFIQTRAKRGLPGYSLSNGDLPRLEARLFEPKFLEAQGMFDPAIFEKALAKKNYRKALLMAQIWLDVHVFQKEETFELIEADRKAQGFSR